MRAVTDFADLAVLLPVACLVALFMGVAGWWRGLLAWVFSVGGTLAVMFVLKAAGAALADDPLGTDAASPSGHVAAACVVYGGLAVLLLRGRMSAPFLFVAPGAVALVIGYSRIELLAHSLGEVVSGAAVGYAGVAVLAATAGPRPRLAAWPVMAVTAVTACAMLACHGLHLGAEAAIRSAFLPR